MREDDERQSLPVSVLGLWSQSGKWVSLSVATGSMRPLIRPGDRVTIRLGDPDRVRSGDIVAYLRNDRVFVHRLMLVWGHRGCRRFWQKGDALSGWGAFDEEAFLGRVEQVHRGSALLDMDRGAWPLINRGLGMAGMARMMVIITGRWIKRRMTGNGSLNAKKRMNL